MSLTHDEFERMKNWEERFRFDAGLVNRSQYKIFYGRIHTAPILLLGINPGGHPNEISSNGASNLNGIGSAAASAGYYENDESDLLDCSWPENKILKLIDPIATTLGLSVRQDVAKTNLSFHRSVKAKKTLIVDQMAIAKDILTQIISVVDPRLIILSCSYLNEFVQYHCANSRELQSAQRDTGVGHIVFWPWEIVLNNSNRKCLLVQVAHASQFAWTYNKYDVSLKILKLLKEQGGEY